MSAASSANLPNHGCIFCALKSLFANYAYSSYAVLPPDAVRFALSEVFSETQRFLPGAMEDADETFEYLLGGLHMLHVIENNNLPGVLGSINGVDNSWYHELPCEPRCIPHEVFALKKVDLKRCRNCGASNDLIEITCFVYRVVVADVAFCLNKFRNSKVNKYPTQVNSGHNLWDCIQFDLQRYLCFHWRNEGCVGELNNLNGEPPLSPKKTFCLSCGCEGHIVNFRYLLNKPKVFVLSLVWCSNKVDSNQVTTILTQIPPLLTLDNVFACEGQELVTEAALFQVDRLVELESEIVASVSAMRSGKSLSHVFRGFICYYELHYVVFLFRWSRMTWILHDDASVTEYLTWGDIIKWCNSHRVMPCLLFFEDMSFYGECSSEQLYSFCSQMEDGRFSTSRAHPSNATVSQPPMARPNLKNKRPKFRSCNIM